MRYGPRRVKPAFFARAAVCAILARMRKGMTTTDREALADLARCLASIDRPETALTLLEELLTTGERHDLALRWRLLRLLREGVPQRRIARDLRVSLCKITRGSSVLKAPESVCRALLDHPAVTAPAPSQGDA